jgi:hypothetical protein
MTLIIPFNTINSQKNIYNAIPQSIALQALRQKYARMLNSRITSFKPRRLGF